MSERDRSPIRFLAASLLVVVSACNSAPSSGGQASYPPLHLRVLAIHDFHGALRPVVNVASGRSTGGAAALKAVMDELQSACACPTVRVDGGDQMQGTLESNLSSGVAAVAALNHLGLDAAAVGNHELDWGVETLLSRQREARYAWLAANVFRVADGSRPDWAAPFTMVERAGMKVGIVGYATVSTPRTLRPVVSEPYEFRSGLAGIRDALDAVWRLAPDFVIVVAHAGGECRAEACTGEMVDLASEVPQGRVHLIIGGHNHNPGDGVVKGVPIIRAGSNGRAVGVVDLYRRADGVHAFRMSQQPVHADAVTGDRVMTDLIAPYLLAAESRGREPLATLAEPLSAAASGDRRLGGLIADAARQLAGADIGLHNPGGVRADLPRGLVSYADLHRVMPFDNMVVRLTLTGSQLRELARQAGARYYYANLRVGAEAGGDGAVSLSWPDGGSVDDKRTYSLGTSDFLADGGDGLLMLATLPREPLGVTLLDAVVQRLRQVPMPALLPASPRDLAAPRR